MEFNQQANKQNSIISADSKQIKLANNIVKIPCFVSVNYQVEVAFSDINKIDKKLLFPLINKDEIDLLIIGTGESVRFLSPKQLVDFNQIGLSVETMNSVSARHSFNLLLADARAVGLLLL